MFKIICPVICSIALVKFISARHFNIWPDIVWCLAVISSPETPSNIRPPIGVLTLLKHIAPAGSQEASVYITKPV